PHSSPLFPYTTLFRSWRPALEAQPQGAGKACSISAPTGGRVSPADPPIFPRGRTVRLAWQPDPSLEPNHGNAPTKAPTAGRPQSACPGPYPGKPLGPTTRGFPLVEVAEEHARE